ncbi:MAG TPA: VCBS repeat-containing protein, partial [Terriglobales bacterium]|nr:VCBS repeat-containing protein [Terriglobales bacterium]
MRPNFFVAMLACALLSVLLSACGGGSSSAGSSATNPTPPAAGANNPSPPGSSSNPTPPSGSQPGGGGSAPGTGTPSQGGFAEKKSSIPSSGHLITADFNRDGRPDLLSYGSSLVVLLNNGSGDFGGPISIGIPSPYTGMTQVSLADFNSDGYIDVVACVNNGATAGGAAVFLNDHSGKLIPGQVVSAPARCIGVGA